MLFNYYKFSIIIFYYYYYIFFHFTCTFNNFYKMQRQLTPINFHVIKRRQRLIWTSNSLTLFSLIISSSEIPSLTSEFKVVTKWHISILVFRLCRSILWIQLRPSVCPSARLSVTPFSQDWFISFFWFFAWSQPSRQLHVQSWQ